MLHSQVVNGGRWKSEGEETDLGEESVLIYPFPSSDGAVELISDLPLLGLQPSAPSPCAFASPVAM